MRRWLSGIVKRVSGAVQKLWARWFGAPERPRDASLGAAPEQRFLEAGHPPAVKAPAQPVLDAEFEEVRAAEPMMVEPAAAPVVAEPRPSPAVEGGAVAASPRADEGRAAAPTAALSADLEPAAPVEAAEDILLAVLAEGDSARELGDEEPVEPALEQVAEDPAEAEAAPAVEQAAPAEMVVLAEESPALSREAVEPVALGRPEGAAPWAADPAGGAAAEEAEGDSPSPEGGRREAAPPVGGGDEAQRPEEFATEANPGVGAEVALALATEPPAEAPAQGGAKAPSELGDVVEAAAVPAAPEAAVEESTAVAEVQAAPAAEAPAVAVEAAAELPTEAAAAVLQATAEPLAEEPVPAAVAAPEPAPAKPRPVIEIPTDYVPAAESEHALYQLSLETFEGPLDLLLFLIRRHKLDVFDIPMAFICERYLEYIKLMEDLNIDVAAEFLATAAELLHIKSKMLLPSPEDDEAEEEGVDPREELVRRLLEYDKFKNAAGALGGLTRLGRDTFGREPEPMPAAELDAELAPLKEVGVFALVELFDEILKRQSPEFRHRVVLERMSVSQRIRMVVSVLATQGMTRFLELLGAASDTFDVVITFLSMLEMTKLQLVRIYQSEEGELYLKPRFESLAQAEEKMSGLEQELTYGN